MRTNAARRSLTSNTLAIFEWTEYDFVMIVTSLRVSSFQAIWINNNIKWKNRREISHNAREYWKIRLRSRANIEKRLIIYLIIPYDDNLQTLGLLFPTTCSTRIETKYERYKSRHSSDLLFTYVELDRLVCVRKTATQYDKPKFRETPRRFIYIFSYSEASWSKQNKTPAVTAR